MTPALPGPLRSSTRPRRLASVRVKIITWVLLLTALGMAIALGTSYVIENKRISSSVDAELI